MSCVVLSCVTVRVVVMPFVTMLLIVMLFVVMLLMRLVTMGVVTMRVVIIPLFGMLLRPAAFIAVIMGFECRPLTERQDAGARLLQQGQMARAAGKRFQRIGQPRGQQRADPDDQVRPAQRPRLGRAHRIAMWRTARRHDEVGRANPFHHLRHQRVNRGDIRGDCGHIRPKRRCGRGKNGSGERETIHGRPSKCYSITLLTPLL